ncbi:MAG: 1-acyl-sn-glycerol-3-phosphate acyltransferase [Bacteroidales bacterium]|nr:1-acyl-sn-glycerol-3-phosphate acyltransferase [Bacteroidales bacterium]MBQ3984592.1 1-acyl-sn-glycerol-3-phosphate acyltransferase [Bacteroidales bacterium]MBQ4188728.1 1-acyl-sn-glycerol-3-phosphate acyltransferase [Bacteroidales bacterium]
MSENQSMAIDLNAIVKSKAGKKKIPAFAIKLLGKILHLDLINKYLVQGYEGVEFCDKCLDYLDVKLEVEGLENIDTSGNTRYTFASNHPLGGIDGISLGMVLGKAFDGKVKYLVNDILMNLKGLAPICVPINKVGGQSRDLPRLISEAYESENQMIIFPAGKCSRKIDGIIQDVPWSKSFITKSVETKRDIVPIHFIGQNSKKFYNRDLFFKKIGIKANLTMLFLPDEMFKNRHTTFKVKIGKPIPYTFFDSSKSAQQWAQWVREEAYKI